VFDSPTEVIRGLLTYTDWWQPASTSVLQVGSARRGSDFLDGIRDGLLDTLGERAELCRRMQQVGHLDRQILFLWYVKQLSAQDIARAVGVSRRQCFRRRAKAIRALIAAGEDQTTSEPEHAA
jgi:DNA-directed RNA polymerase specialized sigma24 family protein